MTYVISYVYCLGTVVSKKNFLVILISTDLDYETTMNLRIKLFFRPLKASDPYDVSILTNDKQVIFILSFRPMKMIRTIKVPNLEH